MLTWAIAFLIIAILGGIFGGIVAGPVGPIAFLVFFALFAWYLVRHLMSRRK
jgi:uncharacterized membrane protein YtjA (UPF0391 family)